MDARRPEADRQRDLRDQPRQVLAFLGIRPGMTVFDLNSASGYYAAVLAQAVGPQGRVIAHNHPGAIAMLGEQLLAQRYGEGRLPNVEQLVVRHQDLKPAAAGLDAVLMSMVYHDAYWYDPKVDWGPIDPVAMLKALHDALKPGGIVGVIDHVAAAGSEPGATAMALHRIDPEVVKRDFLLAGFVLEAESGLLRNAADDHTRGVFDASVHGRTDRFLMRLRKP